MGFGTNNASALHQAQRSRNGPNATGCDHRNHPVTQATTMSANTVPFPAQSRLFGKYFEYSRYNDVVRAMHGMLAGIPDGHACVLSNLEGHHLAHAAAPMLDAPRLAAVASSLSNMAETLTRDLGQHGFTDMVVQTDAGIAVIQRVPRPGHQMVMLTATGHETNPSLLSSLTRHCATIISTLSSASTER
jgi:predicted regulator of Ras-like GTPase activity (Roadblock/LC7/MglB family)